MTRFEFDSTHEQAGCIDVDEHDPGKALRLAAVKILTDQQALARAAMNDQAWEVRQEAFFRLTDQRLLADVAIRDPHRMGDQALERLTDQSLLADVVRHAGNSSVRVHALERLTDPALLTAIANADAAWYRYEWEEEHTECAECEHREVCGWQDCTGYGEEGRKPFSEIVSCSFDLRDVARERLDELNTREKYLNKLFCGVGFELDDPRRIRAVAYETEEAVRRLTDQRELANIAMAGRFAAVRREALAAVTDQNLLAEIAIHAEDGDTCLDAAERLTDPVIVRQAYIFLATGDPDEDIRLMALGLLTDPDAWAEVVQEGDYDDVRQIARHWLDELRKTDG